MSVRLFIGNLPYAATEAELREHLSSVGEPTQLSSPSTGKPAARAASRSSITRIAPSPKRRSAGSISNHSKDARSRSARRGRARSGPPARRARAASARPRPVADRGRGGPGGFAAATRAAGHRARLTAAAARRGRAQPQLRPGRPAEAQAQAAAKDARPRPEGTDQGASGQPPLRERRGLAQRRSPTIDIDNIATSAKVDPEGDQDDE